MITSVSFKLSFKIFQWMLVLIIVFSTFLGYQFYQINVQAQKTENQRLWLVTKLNQFHSRADNLTFLSKQYIVTSNPSFLKKYSNLKIRNTKLIYENDPSQAAEDVYQPFSLNERVLLKKIVKDDLRLREIEKTVINKKAKQIITYSSIASQENSSLLSREYTSISLNLVTSIEKILFLVNKRYQKKINKLEVQRSGLILTIPAILVVNLILLVFSFLYMNRRMDQYHSELKSLTLKDYLTGVHNRKYLMEAGPLLLAVNKREGTQVAVMMLDIDHFKKVNDHHGHDIGDQVLKMFCNSVSNRIRKGDIFARIGGEEFVLLLNKVNAGDAERYANELRSILSRDRLKTMEHKIKYTVSIGVSMSDEAGDLAELLCLADSALYEAKNSGRDQVVMHAKDEQLPEGLIV